MKNIKYSALFLVAGLLVTFVIGSRNFGLFSRAGTPDGKLLEEGLSLSPISPDEPVNYTFNQRFSRKNALDRTTQISNALSSFQQLTLKAQLVLGDAAIQEVDNTSQEIQSIAFPNWVGAVEGTIRKQDYQIKKLEFELAQKKYEDGEIDRATLDAKSEHYRLTIQDFQTFWESLTVID